MKSKLKFVIPVLLLLVLGGVYKFVIAKPTAKADAKIDGTVYVLPKEFLVNLADGRFAKLGVGLVLAPNEHSLVEAAEDKEAVIRDIVTDTLTDRDAGDLTAREGREKLKKKIIKAITQRTDVHVEDVLFTDVAVQ
jgi:flagellar FliL protein